MEKRESLVAELLSTEKNFVNKLGLIVTYFLKPLSENADSSTPFISRANLRGIFGELNVVHGLNTVLLKDLEGAISTSQPSVSLARVGKVFLKMGSFLRWYHSYVSNYDNAFATLKKLKSRSAPFRAFISTTESKPELNFTDLESLLILPIQRIPQYNLIFSDLVKCTPSSHPDHADTVSALQLMNQIGSYINEKKREAENIAQVIAIGKSLVGFPNLAVPYRRFVRKSRLFQIPDNGAPSEVLLFAFNDILLLAQQTEPNQFTVNQYAYWDRVTILLHDSSSSKDSSSTTPATPKGDSATATSTLPPDNPLSIHVRLKETVYYFAASSPDERKEWISLIKDHVERTKKKTTERENQISVKRKLISLHNNPQPQGSLALRSLGVLAKGMLMGGMHLDDTTAGSLDSSSSSSTASSPASNNAITSSSGGVNDISNSSSTNTASTSTLTGSSPNQISGAFSVALSSVSKDGSGGNNNAGGGLLSARSARSAEERARSKKTREAIESEVKQQLLKEGVKDGSIDEFLASHQLEAFYVVPLYLSTKANAAAALLALTSSTFSIFIKSKIQYTGFLYDIKEVSSKDHPDFNLKMTDGTNFDCRSQFCDDVIYQLRRAYLLTYYGIPDHFTWSITTDDWRQPDIVFDSEKIVLGGFKRTYRAACSYLNIAYREDIVWDLMHTESTHQGGNGNDSGNDSDSGSNAQHLDLKLQKESQQELDLSRLEDLTNNDLKSLMFALRFNPFFTSLVVRDMALSRDGFAAIADLFRYNHHLKRLVLKSNSISKDHIALLTEPFNATPTATFRKFEVIDIRDNNIDGVPFVVKYLETHKKFVALTTLDLANSGLTSKAATALWNTMRKSTNLYHTLETLNLSGSKMDAEATAAAASFLATPCAVKHLDLSNTQAKLQQLLEAVTRGCIYLNSLDISQNKITKKMEVVLVKFVTKMDSLTCLKMNDTGLPAETFARIVEAASSNVYLKHLKLEADENEMGPLGATFIARSLKDMKGIDELSLADNDFGDEGMLAIFQALEGTVNLSRLFLDANFKLKTAKSRSSMIQALVKLVCHKDCKLQLLSIAGSKTSSSPASSSPSLTSARPARAANQLRTDLIPFLEHLPKIQVAELNISGHRMGPKGIVALGRALQEASPLKKLWWDENGTTPDSFMSLVRAVKSNTTLTGFGPPLMDLSSIMGQGDTLINTRILLLVEALATHICRNTIRLQLNPHQFIMSPTLPPAVSAHITSNTQIPVSNTPFSMSISSNTTSSVSSSAGTPSVIVSPRSTSVDTSISTTGTTSQSASSSPPSAVPILSLSSSAASPNPSASLSPPLSSRKVRNSASANSETKDVVEAKGPDSAPSSGKTGKSATVAKDHPVKETTKKEASKDVGKETKDSGTTKDGLKESKGDLSRSSGALNAASNSSKVTRKELGKLSKSEKMRGMGRSAEAVVTTKSAVISSKKSKSGAVDSGKGTKTSAKHTKRGNDTGGGQGAEGKIVVSPRSATSNDTASSGVDSDKNVETTIVVGGVGASGGGDAVTSLKGLRQPSQASLAKSSPANPTTTPSSTLSSSSHKITPSAAARITGIAVDSSKSQQSPSSASAGGTTTTPRSTGENSTTSSKDVVTVVASELSNEITPSPSASILTDTTGTNDEKVDDHTNDEDDDSTVDNEEILELDENYNENDDSDFYEDADMNTAESAAASDDEELDENAEEHDVPVMSEDEEEVIDEIDISKIKKVHYRTESDNEEEEMAMPLSPKASPHRFLAAALHEKDKEDEVPVIPHIKVTMKPGSVPDDVVSPKSSKPKLGATMQPSASLALLQNAALSLPSDLRIDSPSSSESSSTIDSPARTPSNPATPEPQIVPHSTSPPPLSARALRNSIVLEYGGSAYSSDDENEATERDGNNETKKAWGMPPEEEDSMHAISSFDHPPTMPEDIVLTSPRSDSKTEAQQQEAAKEKAEPVISPRANLASSAVDSLTSSHSSSLANVGMFEHAPMMPIESSTPRQEEQASAAISPRSQSPTTTPSPTTPREPISLISDPKRPRSRRGSIGEAEVSSATAPEAEAASSSVATSSTSPMTSPRSPERAEGVKSPNKSRRSAKKKKH